MADPKAVLTPEGLRALHEGGCPISSLPYDWTDHSSLPACRCTLREELLAYADAWAAEIARREAMAKLLREACWVAYEGANFLMCNWCDVTAEDGKGQDYLDAIPHAPDCRMAALASQEDPRG